MCGGNRGRFVVEQRDASTDRVFSVHGGGEDGGWRQRRRYLKRRRASTCFCVSAATGHL